LAGEHQREEGRARQGEYSAPEDAGGIPGVTHALQQEQPPAEQEQKSKYDTWIKAPHIFLRSVFFTAP
jgi:hypothetical protein